MVSLNDYITYTVSDIIQSFMLSNRSSEVQSQLLNSTKFRELELVYDLFVRFSYSELLDVTRTLYQEGITDFEHEENIIIIFINVFLVCMYIYLLAPLHESLMKENKMLKLFLSLIPIGVFIKNKTLMKYLIQKTPNNNNPSIISKINN